MPFLPPLHCFCLHYRSHNCVYIHIYIKNLKNEWQQLNITFLGIECLIHLNFISATHQCMNQDLPQILFFHYFLLHVHILVLSGVPAGI